MPNASPAAFLAFREAELERVRADEAVRGAAQALANLGEQVGSSGSGDGCSPGWSC